MLDRENFNLSLPKRKRALPGAFVLFAVIAFLIYLLAPAIQFYLEGSQ